LVATDRYRLSYQKTSLKTLGDLAKPIVVPARVIKEMMFLKEDEDSISFFVSGENNQVLLFQGESILVGRLIDAEYPEYNKIIPTEFSTKVGFQREEMLKAIKICSVFARETANIIKISIEKNKIIISANSPSVGEDTVEVEAKMSGEENEIAFNAKYVVDVLSALSAENMIFEMNGPLSPGVFKIEGDNTFLHLIMPIRVQG
jgi:DNA polymerase-3 subunit beta